MDNPTPKWPELYVRWNKAGWPVLAMRPEQVPAEPAPKAAEQVAAKQEWDAEGGAIKPAPVAAHEPKLPL